MSEPKPRYDFRRLCAWQLYAAIFTFGCFPDVSGTALLDPLLRIYVACAATYWAVLDARKQGYPIPHIAQFLLLAAWPIGLPIYLIWSRGLRGLGWAFLHAAGLFAAMALGSAVSTWLFNAGL